MSARTLIAGIGNRLRGDDALGCLIAERLLSVGIVAADVIEHDGEPASLIDRWQDHDRVILVDAVSSGAAPGSIVRLDLNEEALPESCRETSTHAFGVAEAVELARALGKLPRQIVFIGVELGDVSTGSRPSPAIEAAIESVLSTLAQETHA